jgi:sugar fermentation stimulation protein A
MQFSEPVRQAEFLQRYKRFFADVRVNGQTVVAHVPNTGSMKSCLFPGAPCVITESSNPNRKLKATLQLIKAPTSWVGVNTALPNALAYEAWESSLIPDWRPFKFARREYAISKATRIDLVLASDEDCLINKRNLHFVEIKNVTYAEGNTAMFPDAVTTRGQKHLRELIQLKQQGFGAEILFVVQRQDCRHFAPADQIDPEYGRLLREARDQGVTIRTLGCTIVPERGISLATDELPILSF